MACALRSISQPARDMSRGSSLWHPPYKHSYHYPEGPKKTVFPLLDHSKHPSHIMVGYFVLQECCFHRPRLRKLPVACGCAAEMLGASEARTPKRCSTEGQFLGILYYTILYYTILYYTILYYALLYFTILYYTILYYTILYYTILYYTILYYTILYYTILYYTIVYYIVLQGVTQFHAPPSRPDCPREPVHEP